MEDVNIDCKVFDKNIKVLKIDLPVILFRKNFSHFNYLILGDVLNVYCKATYLYDVAILLL